MFAVYEAGDLVEAELLLQRLAERGIRAVVRNRFLQGALGELPLSVRPVVAVLDERDVAAALACVREIQAAAHAPDPGEVVCPACGDTSPGNFETCWRCGADLPM